MQVKTILNRIQRHRSFVYGPARLVQGHQLALEVEVEVRSGPRKLDSVLSEIFLGIQAANPEVTGSKYTASGVRLSSAL